MCEDNGMILGMTAVVVVLIVVSIVAALAARFFEWLSRPTPISMDSIERKRITRRRGDA